MTNMSVLSLLRLPTLLLLVFVQASIYFLLIKPLVPSTPLDVFQWSLLVVASVCIAAAGYVLHAIESVDIDRVNYPNRVVIHPHVQEKSAFNLNIALNMVVVGIGFWVSYQLGKPSYATWFILCSALLYLYATSFYKKLLIGNLIVALLVFLNVLTIPIFAIIPMLPAFKGFVVSWIFQWSLGLGVGAFIVSFIREIIKDAYDMDGDYSFGVRSIPILIGIRRTGVLCGVLCVGTALLSFGIMYRYLYTQLPVVLYVLLGIIGPLLYISTRCFSVKHKKNIPFISTFLKGILVAAAGILVLMYFTIINPKHHYVTRKTIRLSNHSSFQLP